MAEITRRETVAEDHRLPTRSESAAPAGHVEFSAVNGRGGDPDALRSDIERTRARMSDTLDEIEGRLVRQKDQIVARATFRDLRRKVSSEPWRSIAIAFVAGYVVAAIRD